METLGAALISAVAAIIVCVVNSNAQHKKFLAEIDKQNELQAYRIEQLEKKVDKHNNLVERVYKLEQSTEIQKEAIKVSNHRIGDLEEIHKGGRNA